MTERRKDGDREGGTGIDQEWLAPLKNVFRLLKLYKGGTKNVFCAQSMFGHSCAVQVVVYMLSHSGRGTAAAEIKEFCYSFLFPDMIMKVLTSLGPARLCWLDGAALPGLDIDDPCYPLRHVSAVTPGPTSQLSTIRPTSPNKQNQPVQTINKPVMPTYQVHTAYVISGPCRCERS